MRVILEVHSGPHKGHKVVLSAGQSLQVGRTEWADFSLPHDNHMSSVHFLLGTKEGTCYVKDLDSTKGTFVNRERIGVAGLSHGDRITAGQTIFAVHVQGGVTAAKAKVPTEVFGAWKAEPTAPPGVAPTRIEYRKQHCDSELVAFFGCQSDPPPGTIARLLAQDAPPYLLVGINKLRLPQPEDLTEPTYLMDWLPEDSRARCSPLLLAESDKMDLFSLIGDGWGKDGLICIYSEQEKPELLAQLRRVAGAFVRPSILTPQLSHGAPEFVGNLLLGMEAVLLEDDSPGRWVLFSRSEYGSTLAKLGFVEKPASEDSRRNRSNRRVGRGERVPRG